MNDFGGPRFSTLGGKLLAAYLLAVTVAFLVFFSTLEYQNFQHHKQNLTSRLETFVAHQASVLASPLWNLSESTIRSTVEAISKDGDLLYVELTDEQGEILIRLPQGESRVGPPELTARKSIVHRSSEEEIVIGAVEIAFHQDRLIALITSRLWADAIILMIALAIITAVTLWTTRAIVIAPLNRLLEAIHSAKLGRQPSPVALSSNDELGMVMRSYNELQEQQTMAEATLRESEARLSKAAELAKIGYWVWDNIEDKAIYCSEGLAEIYGVASGAELVTMLSSHAADLEWIHPEDREYFDEAAHTASETKNRSDIEYRLIDSAGKVRYLHAIEEPVLDERGEIVRTNGITQDITEHKRAEEQLRQAQKMEAVGQLTAGVAHDFNNMLAVISGNAELLGDELGKENPQLSALFRATRRAADLTQRLLAFSRKQMLSPEIVNANRLITDTTGLLRRTLEEHIDIKTLTATGLWTCEADPAQLENALVNLALNARDAMPDGGKLTIETRNVLLDDDYAAAQAEVTPGHYVMLAVTDTGFGMPPEVRQHAFEPFFTTKDVGAGSGLGLSMVYGFAKQSGGHVAIYSEVGEGTTIKLYLPRSIKTEVIETNSASDEVPAARGESVLVVEDDPEVRTLVIALLGSLGYQIMEAGTAAAALELLGSATGVNLLLTDVMLAGGMNGRELATEAERRAPGIPVLYMSGYTEDAIVHHGRLDADAELLPKPFRRADLARAVRKVLDS